MLFSEIYVIVHLIVRMNTTQHMVIYLNLFQECLTPITKEHFSN